MEIVIKAESVRVYFNASSEVTKEWCVDFGKDSVEIRCGSVVMHALGMTVCMPEVVPSGWIVFRDVTVTIKGNQVCVDESTA